MMGSKKCKQTQYFIRHNQMPVTEAYFLNKNQSLFKKARWLSHTAKSDTSRKETHIKLNQFYFFDVA